MAPSLQVKAEGFYKTPICPDYIGIALQSAPLNVYLKYASRFAFCAPRI
jgi:hypothetical protein